jgi:methionyl-tRNA formyltransferase
MMRLVFFGSGEFGLPTLRKLCETHEIALVVTQPNRPAGRHRVLTATPIAEFATINRIPTIKPERVNEPSVLEQIRACKAEAAVVIAFGQKLGPELLRDWFIINLHGSLLPKYRGAAPIQWAIINGEREIGVSVIGVTDRMDAGPIYGQASLTIDPLETAGELHDRLAQLGPETLLDVLTRHEHHRLIPQHQDERLATKAPKLSKNDGTVRFDQSAERVRNRVHGLTPWPGCAVKLDGRTLRLARVDVADQSSVHSSPGEVLADLSVACANGSIRLLEIQPPGGKLMSIDAYRNGQPFAAGMKLEPL